MGRARRHLRRTLRLSVEHLLTKDELARVGRSLPADSSATVAFVRGADPERLLSSVAAFQPTSASVAAVTSSLSARVRRAIGAGLG